MVSGLTHKHESLHTVRIPLKQCPLLHGHIVTVVLPLLCFRFLLQCLEDLDTSLRKLNSRLFVIRGQPANIFPQLFKVRPLFPPLSLASLTPRDSKYSPCCISVCRPFQSRSVYVVLTPVCVCCVLSSQDWNTSQLTFECDSEPFGKERDAAIKKLATEAGVEVISRISHTLYDLDK